MELEMTLNYFPHAVWQDIAEQVTSGENSSIRSMRERFYTPLVSQTLLQLDVLTNSQFIAVFQGLCLCGSHVFKLDAFNQVLNSFVERLGEETKIQEKIEFD